MQISFDAIVLTDNQKAREFFGLNGLSCIWVGDFWKSVRLAEELNYEYVITLDQNCNFQDALNMLGLVWDYDLVVASSKQWLKHLSAFRVYRTSLLQTLMKFEYPTDEVSLQIELLERANKVGADICVYQVDQLPCNLNWSTGLQAIKSSYKILTTYPRKPKFLESTIY